MDTTAITAIEDLMQQHGTRGQIPRVAPAPVEYDSYLNPLT